MKYRLLRTLVAGLAAACVLVPTVATASPSAATVRVTLKEFGVALSARSAPKGSVVFVVTNRGKLPHDFKIAGKRTSQLAPGKSTRLTVKFSKSGRYPYLCSVAGHAPAGMKGAFVVR